MLRGGRRQRVELPAVCLVWVWALELLTNHHNAGSIPISHLQYILCLNALFLNKCFISKVLVGAFNKKKALAEASSGHCEISRRFIDNCTVPSSLLVMYEYNLAIYSPSIFHDHGQAARKKC